MSRDRTVGDTFYIAFTTRAFATGVPTVLAGTPVISAYEDGSLTQITAGLTLGVDHDSVVGLNMITVVATGANGFESGKDYQLVITTGTVGGVSVVGEVVGQFSLGLSAAAVDLANGTDGLGAIKADSAAILVDTADMQPKVAKIPLSDGTITFNSTALASINAECDTALTDYDGPTNAEMNARTLLAASYFDPAADTVANVTTVATLTGHTAQTGDSFARIGVAGAGLTDITLNAASIDLIWDEPLTGGTHNVATSSGKRLRQLDASFEVHSGTAQAGTSTTITLDTGASTTDDIYNGDRIVITDGTGVQEHGLIIDYDGTTKIATMSKAWVVTPDATSVFVVSPADCDIETWNNTAVTGDGDWAQSASDTAAILVDTGTTIPATLGSPAGASVSADIADLPTVAEFNARTLATADYFDPAADTVANVTLVATTTDVTNQVTADVTAISGDSTAADNLEASLETLVLGTATGTPTTTTMADSALTETTNDHYNGRIIIWRTGNLAGQATDITGYNGTTKTFTFTATTDAASASDAYVIV